MNIVMLGANSSGIKSYTPINPNFKRNYADIMLITKRVNKLSAEALATGNWTVSPTTFYLLNAVPGKGVQGRNLWQEASNYLMDADDSEVPPMAVINVTFQDGNTEEYHFTEPEWKAFLSSNAATAPISKTQAQDDYNQKMGITAEILNPDLRKMSESSRPPYAVFAALAIGAYLYFK